MRYEQTYSCHALSESENIHRIIVKLRSKLETMLARTARITPDCYTTVYDFLYFSEENI